MSLSEIFFINTLYTHNMSIETRIKVASNRKPPSYAVSRRQPETCPRGSLSTPYKQSLHASKGALTAGIICGQAVMSREIPIYERQAHACACTIALWHVNGIFLDTL